MGDASLQSEMTQDADADGGVIEYRTVPSSAVAGLLLGLLSVVTLVAATSSLQGSLLLTPIPVVGFFLSLQAWNKIRHDPEAYTGANLALAGVVSSLLFLVTGMGYGTYVHVTEVPADHTRVSFEDMRPDSMQERAGIVVPPEIMALDGQRVFIKGYMRPPKVRNGIEQFLLVRDNNQCCFGDISSLKYYDRIQVDLQDKLRLSYTDGVFAVGGVLHVVPQNVAYGAQAAVFALEADYAK